MRQLEFSVELIARDSERLCVGGRVHRDLIRVGDCFTRSVANPAPDNDGNVSDGRIISLVVRAILTYRKYINQIDSGMTAELEMEPLDGILPVVGEVLIGKSDSPPFGVYEILGEGEFHVTAM